MMKTLIERVRNWFRVDRLESDLDRELKYHFDRRVGDLVQEGLSEAEAQRRVNREMGGVAQVREEVHDVWLTRWLRDFVYDLRFSARSFGRNPSFTATAVLSLALGIGATTAIYSLVDQVLLHSLPVREPAKLALIDWKGDPATGAFGSYNLMSYPICRDLNQQTRIFEGVLCRAAMPVNFSSGGEHVQVVAEIVSGNYFEVLGIKPAAGRLLTPEDDAVVNSSPVVVISHDYWMTQMGGARDVIGRKVFVNRNPMTVVGVAAPDFRGIDVGEVPSFWMPSSMMSNALAGFDRREDRWTRWMQVIGRLRPEMTLEQAQAGLQPWFKSMLQEDSNRAGFPKIRPERRHRYFASYLELTTAAHGHAPMRRRLGQPLWVLLAATAVLLGLACLNVAGLFLARGSARQREVSTRLALGASSGRIARQLLADSLLLALAGGVLGVMLAPVVMRTLIAFLPPGVAPTALESTINLQLLSVAFLVSLATGLLTGSAPAFHAGRGGVIAALKERGVTTFGGLRLRRVIVTAQIACTLVLVIGAALFVRTLGELMAKGPGFSTSSLISFGIAPIRNGHSQADTNRLVQTVYDQLRESRGTESASMLRYQLLSGGTWNNPMTIQASQRTITDREVHMNSITPGFFDTLGAKVLAGRRFDERDSRTVKEGGRPVAIVNDVFVKRYLGGQNPLGVRVGFGTGPDVKTEIEIVGVVSNISYRGMREEWEQIYFPMTRDGYFQGSHFYVRVQGSSEAAFASIRAILHRADPTMSATYFRTLDEQVNRALSMERMLAALSAGFGVLALLLSLVGLYGVMSFMVTQRTREIGIRLALGATRGTAVWLVLRDALMMLAVGVAIALPGVWALGRLVETQLYGVRPMDPVMLIGATVILGVGSLCAALIPARRASAVNATEALRFE